MPVLKFFIFSSSYKTLQIWWQNVGKHFLAVHLVWHIFFGYKCVNRSWTGCGSTRTMYMLLQGSQLVLHQECAINRIFFLFFSYRDSVTRFLPPSPFFMILTLWLKHFWILVSISRRYVMWKILTIVNI